MQNYVDWIVQDILSWTKSVRVEREYGRKVIWRLINPSPADAAFFTVSISNSANNGLAEDLGIQQDGDDLLITTVAK